MSAQWRHQPGTASSQAIRVTSTVINTAGQDAEGMALYLCTFPPQMHHPSLIMRGVSAKSQVRDSVPNACPGVMENKESLRGTVTAEPKEPPRLCNAACGMQSWGRRGPSGRHGADWEGL